MADSQGDERKPLLNLEHRRSLRDCPVGNVAHIPHTESIFNSILFIPPLARSKSGHYWTREVFIAFAIFAMNITIQGGLVFLGGRDIIDRNDLWKASLLEDITNDTYWDRTGSLQRVRSSSEYIWNGAHWVVHGGSEEEVQSCCTGAQCALLEVACCPSKPHGNLSQAVGTIAHRSLSSRHDAASSSQLTDFLVSKRPGGGGGGKAAAAKSKKKSRESDDDSGDVGQRNAALCQRSGARVSCKPPTLGFLDHWQDLDFDGDGIWTQEEASADEANLACRLGVPVEDVFYNACKGIQQDLKEAAEINGKVVNLPIDIVQRKAIAKPFFELWRGIAALCLSTDAGFCSQLLYRGLFDGAMDPAVGAVRGGVMNLDSAMSYCNRLLTPGGLCDVSLPGSYVLYRSKVQAKCGDHIFGPGPRYTNPFDKADIMGTTSVLYSTHAEYLRTHDWDFIAFLLLVLFMWYSTLVDELREVLQLGDFLRNFPVDRNIHVAPLMSARLRHTLSDRFRMGHEHSDSSLEPAAKEHPSVLQDVVFDDVSQTYEIRRISSAHWNMCMLMFAIRLFMAVYLALAGTIFLLSNHTFIDLLLNSVALAFIFGLDQVNYSLMFSEETKQELQSVQPLRFPSSLPQKGQAMAYCQKGSLALFGIPILCIGVAWWNDWHNTVPILEALECACFKQGTSCQDSSIFEEPWWKRYWIDSAKLIAPLQKDSF